MKSFSLASYALYFLSGLTITAIGSVMPRLLAYYDLSYTVGGQLVFLGSVGFVIGVPFSTFLMNRLNEKSLLSLAALFVAFAQLGLLLLPPVGWVFLLNFFNGVGVAMLETVVATLMMEVFVGRRAVSMSYLEVSFGVGALVMPLIASLFIAQGVWRFSFLIPGLIGVLLAVVWRVISYSKKDASTVVSLDATTSPPPVISSPKTKWLFLSLFTFMIFVYTGIEGSLNNFLSSVFVTYLGEVPYFASLSIGIFWAAMVLGRVATGWVIRKVTYSRYLLFSIAGTLAGLACFALWKNAIAGYVIVALLGLAMSGIYSITMVFANHSLPGMARLVTGSITGFAGVGQAVFPIFIGFTMDH
ncbi:MAG TPA: MFS transporter, partial [Bacillales bacterium]|nr:MFS transporter [Bacillales bacterium]